MSKSANDARRQETVLVFSVLLISVCAIVYELLISTISSYFLGSSVLHFSLTIGLFMSFMGVGSYLSKYIEKGLIDRFISIEIAIGLIGGVSAALLYIAFSLTEYYYICAFLIIAAISTMVGLEIPLVMRIVRRHSELKEAVANILTVDYIGALLASVLFPLVLLPYFGLMKTAFLIGLLNLAVAFVCILEFRRELAHSRRQLVFCLASFFLLCLGLFYSFRLIGFFERFLYQDEVVYSAQTPYQRIILTRYKQDTRLFLNGSIQFSSIDEHRYHEPLVHVPLSFVRRPEHVLVLGGGDGLAVREILKYPEVRRVTVVDIDSEITRLAHDLSVLKQLNKDSLHDPRVVVVNEDAYKYIENSQEFYAVVIIDLPDPNDLTLGKLYSKSFYELIKKRLTADGVLVTQSSSPYFAQQAFWSINHTLEAVFPSVLPYSVNVPSFGLWGFNAASRRELNPASLELRVETRFLTPQVAETLFVFDSDMEEVPAEVNRLDNQILVQYYEKTWDNWN